MLRFILCQLAFDCFNVKIYLVSFGVWLLLCTWPSPHNDQNCSTFPCVSELPEECSIRPCKKKLRPFSHMMNWRRKNPGRLNAYLKDIIATVAAANIILKPPVFIFCSILHSEKFQKFLNFHSFSHFTTCGLQAKKRDVLSTCASLSFFKASVLTLPLGPVLAWSTLKQNVENFIFGMSSLG